MSLHLRLLGCLGHAVVDVRSGAATSKCGLPMWRPHGVLQLFIINGRADVDVASAALRPERSGGLALCECSLLLWSSSPPRPAPPRSEIF